MKAFPIRFRCQAELFQLILKASKNMDMSMSDYVAKTMAESFRRKDLVKVPKGVPGRKAGKR